MNKNYLIFFFYFCEYFCNNNNINIKNLNNNKYNFTIKTKITKNTAKKQLEDFFNKAEINETLISKFKNLFFKEKIISTFNEAEFENFNGGVKNEIDLSDFKFESSIQKKNAKFLLEKLKNELPDIQSKDGINTFDDYIKQEKMQKVLKYILYNASKERELKKKEILFSTFFITSFVFFVYKKKFKIKS